MHFQFIFAFMERLKHVLIILLALCSTGLSAREVLNFNKDWKFCLNLETDSNPADIEFDDSGWRTLDVPHDWAIEGDFDEHNPSGTGGGALPGGIGWYRKTFTVSQKDKAQVFSIEFDGVYMNSSVYLNGHLLGTRPYGYISFSYDLTPYINWNGDNVIAVKVDNSDQPNSRWYSGCGIYRDVRIVKTNPVHIPQWGTYVTSTVNSDGTAMVHIEADARNLGYTTVMATVRHTIVNAKGKKVSTIESNPQRLNASGGAKPQLDIKVSNPVLWSLEKPYLYTLVTEILVDGKRVDRYETPFGIRTIEFRADSGFYLNGEHVRINGVCNHHDLGCLGAATNERAIERQLQILKEMGCNGIRCSHNPPSPILLDLCDRMGFLVMDEAFDMWRRRKTDRDYARFFDDWYERDLTDLVVRDRNHPCIVLWSIGNEVLEQWSDAKADTLSLEQANLILNMGHSEDQLAKEGEMSVNSLITARLAGIIKELDPTRPVTAGCNEPSPGNHLFRSGAIDVIGYNYHNQNVPSVPRLFPGKPFIITESVSALMTRGFYEMPSGQMMTRPVRWDRPYFNPTFSCSAYDNVATPWGSHHEENLIFLNSQPFVAGQYIWTGFDYIGEPTPYGWPARSSYFGIVDLAGFPKDVYYLYQAEWTDTPVLHLFPHWNWEPGEQIDMWCYYNNADEVELFINGKSQGTRTKDANHLHVVWNVTFEPGTVKVVARKDGVETASREIHTAGEPAQIRLTPDRSTIKSNGTDLSFVTVEILDKDGNLCPNADNLVEFEISGNGFIAGVDNGSPISLERFKDDKRKAFYGKCLVVLQNNGKKGTIKLDAVAEGLKRAHIDIKCAPKAK
jgi:Beta-galactosidase/beta-glucuronidase